MPMLADSASQKYRLSLEMETFITKLKSCHHLFQIRANNANKAMLITKTLASYITMTMRTVAVVFSFSLLWNMALVLGAEEESADLKGPSSTVDGPTVEGMESVVS